MRPSANPGYLAAGNYHACGRLRNTRVVVGVGAAAGRPSLDAAPRGAILVPMTPEKEPRKRLIGRSTVREALAVHRDAAMVFYAHGITGCDDCGLDENETLETACRVWGVPLDPFLEILNAL